MLYFLMDEKGMNPVKALEKSADFDHWNMYLNNLLSKASDFGLKLVACVIIYWLGRKVIRYIDKLLGKILSGKGVDPSIASFTKSLINVLLTAMLIVGIIAKLGIDTTSFAALLASVGVAIGMALSGTLQNFSGGIMILLFKPYRIGDYIQAQGQEGTVKEIHIFNTEVLTADNKTVFIPNGGLSSNVIVNFNNEKVRRIDLVVGVEYGTDYDFAKSTALEIIREDKRILDTPAPLIALKTLNESSVDLLIRVWVKRENYWDVYFNLNEQVYKTFANKGIGIPFPQVTVHLDK
ncbi:MAG: mechanosensitive ion channel [Dysgonamonadaceae bacterium]|nr:mechanosensitive ion channel [Dysgonamonadaceae bacterium]